MSHPQPGTTRSHLPADIRMTCRRQFEQSISILKEVKAETHTAYAYAGCGRLHKKQGRTAEARGAFARALEISERLGLRLQPDRVREELAELPAG